MRTLACTCAEHRRFMQHVAVHPLLSTQQPSMPFYHDTHCMHQIKHRHMRCTEGVCTRSCDLLPWHRCWHIDDAYDTRIPFHTFEKNMCTLAGHSACSDSVTAIICHISYRRRAAQPHAYTTSPMSNPNITWYVQSCHRSCELRKGHTLGI
jgi:hypothetical protein